MPVARVQCSTVLQDIEFIYCVQVGVQDLVPGTVQYREIQESSLQ